MWDSVTNLITSPAGWMLYFLCAILIGTSKTGIQNVGTLAVPLFAMLFGAKYSTGIVLILLCFADLTAVIYYRKRFNWAEVKKPLPYAIIGLLVGLFVGDYIDDNVFKILMGACIIVGVAIMLWGNRQDKRSVDESFVNKWWYAPVFGLITGFSTMIGNAAGPTLTVYLISKKMDKFTLVATGAWFIMILNFSKIPLQLFVWKNLSWEGFLLNLMAIPFILIGGWIGIKLVKILPEREFRIVILSLVVLSASMLILV